MEIKFERLIKGSDDIIKDIFVIKGSYSIGIGTSQLQIGFMPFKIYYIYIKSNGIEFKLMDNVDSLEKINKYFESFIESIENEQKLEIHYSDENYINTIYIEPEHYFSIMRNKDESTRI